ncbi:DUF3152 domain-containing protein [Streptomyces sp. NPDC002851]
MAVAFWQDTRDRSVADHALDAADELQPASAGPGPGPGDASPSSSASPSPSASTSPSAAPSPSASASPSPPQSRDESIAIPATGPGTFRTAEAGTAAVGAGQRVWRYQVQVEDGIDITTSRAAGQVEAVLADNRGWTRTGEYAFRRVSAGSDSGSGSGSGSYDFVVKIATPGTVDAICGAAGLRTRGEVNCRVGQNVVVNLKRWVLGSPQFDGPIAEYRALIINHEVGHRLGHGHEGCPGPGEPAPAMMQQIKGLNGCVANAWPYDRDGRYLSGPSVP